MAYLDQNKREYELTRQIPLLLHDPLALITLKETGECEFELPEALFDMDYPGHYMRRIKNVSLTIPCVTGPYTGINCTLTLLSNRVRVDANAQRPYPEEDDDTRFVANFAALQSIATSHGQNDSGMFELNFRDERYLPFEGAGAVSRWRIEMPKDCNPFAFKTISDVVLHLRYTAREGGELLKAAARKAVADMIDEGETYPPARLLNVRNEFPSEWHRLKQSGSVEMVIGLDHLPYFAQAWFSAITSVSLFARVSSLSDTFPIDVNGQTVQLTPIKIFGGLHGGHLNDPAGEPLVLGVPLTLEVKDADSMEELFLLLQYKLSPT
jgi:hypothetical protein